MNNIPFVINKTNNNNNISNDNNINNIILLYFESEYILVMITIR